MGLDVFAHAGSLGESLRRVDWSATPLGPVDSWDSRLIGTLEVALRTRFAVTLLWGPDFTLLYNEAYVGLIGDKHPWALGSPAKDVFPEVWDTIGPMLEGVRAGTSMYVEDLCVPLQRKGFLEDCYFTFCYSPVAGEPGEVEGVLDIAIETTAQVLGRRRLVLLERLREQLAEAGTVGEIRTRALGVLGEDPDDLPRCDVRLAAVAPPGVEDDTIRVPVGESGELVVGVPQGLAQDGPYRDFLRLVAAVIGQAFARVGARETERGIVEALQRDLLAAPQLVAGLQLAVRYEPATGGGRLGGDWYDAFPLPDGGSMLVIGDVAGHDRQAVAGMAQIRNLLRGVAHGFGSSPARVLDELDAALADLGVDVLATAFVVRVDRPQDGGPGRRCRWASAGHPPPVLARAGRPATLLEEPPDLLLGLRGGARTDHVLVLDPSDTLVLYTDGLVERRDEGLQTSLAALAACLDGVGEQGVEELCDVLLARPERSAEDDVALLVVRVPA